MPTTATVAQLSIFTKNTKLLAVRLKDDTKTKTNGIYKTTF